MRFTEVDAIAELTASYSGYMPGQLYAERAVLLREPDSAREPTESRLCADHLAVLDAELTRRGLPAGSPPQDTRQRRNGPADVAERKHARSPVSSLRVPAGGPGT
jgi:hypothetical protein